MRVFLKDFKQALNERIKVGTYCKVGWQTKRVVNGLEYTKLSIGVARFLKAKDSNVVLVNKQGVEYVRLFLTHNPKHQTKVAYFCEGVQITKDEYENATGETSKVLEVCFAKHLSDIRFIENKRLQVMRG